MDGDRGRALRSLVALLQRGVVTGGDADEMLGLMCRCFDARGMVLGHEFSYQGWAHLGGDMGDWPTVYHSVADADSTVDEIKSRAPGTWFLVNSEAGVHRRTAVYDAFRAEQFQDVAIARLPSTRGDHITIGVYRERGDRDYDGDDDFFLSLLSPLLARSLSSRTALAALELAPEGDLGATLGAVAGWAIIGYPGAEVCWSRTAEALFEDKLGPIGRRGWKRIDNALLHAAQNTAYTTSDAVRAVHLIRDVTVEFAYVPPEPDETHRVLALFYDDPVADDLDLRDDARCAAEELLSPKQRVVARLAARGWSQPDIARTLGVSTETARDYLRAVYQRLGVDNRADLVRVLG